METEKAQIANLAPSVVETDDQLRKSSLIELRNGISSFLPGFGFHLG
jgi:hypothetical protein